MKEKKQSETMEDVADFIDDEIEEVGNSDSEKDEGNYMVLGMTLGMCFGLTVGSLIFDNMATGLSIGMVLGMTIGMNIKK